MLQRVIADDAVGGGMQEEVVDEIKIRMRAHPVIGKALPHFGGEQIAQPDRVAEKVRSLTTSPAFRAAMPGSPSCLLGRSVALKAGAKATRRCVLRGNRA